MNILSEDLLRYVKNLSERQVWGQDTLKGFCTKIDLWSGYDFLGANDRLTQVLPSVTCCIAFGNDHPYLHESLMSISLQSLRPDKIFVGVDNCLCDGYRIDSASGVKFFSFKGHNGPFAVMNHLINASTTDYVLIMDSDDISHPNRLEILLCAAEENSLDLVGSSVVNFDEGGDEIFTLGVFPTFPYAALKKCMCHSMLYPTILRRRSLYNDVGGFSSFEKFGMDTDFLIRAIHARSSMNLYLPLYAKRRRSVSLTESPLTGAVSARRSLVLKYTIDRYNELHFS